MKRSRGNGDSRASSRLNGAFLITLFLFGLWRAAMSLGQPWREALVPGLLWAFASLGLLLVLLGIKRAGYVAIIPLILIGVSSLVTAVASVMGLEPTHGMSQGQEEPFTWLLRLGGAAVALTCAVAIGLLRTRMMTTA